MPQDPSKIKFGNCYQFDLPDELLDANETQQVIDALLFDFKRTPVSEEFILDIAIGPDSDEDISWQEFVETRKCFQRAVFKKETEKITRENVIDFLRQNFGHMLTLPPPTLKRIK